MVKIAMFKLANDAVHSDRQIYEYQMTAISEVSVHRYYLVVPRAYRAT